MSEKRGRKGIDESIAPDHRVRTLELSGSRISLLGTIKGLLSEAELVDSTIRNIGPDALAAHISKEEIKGLRAVVNGDVETTFLSSYEKVYAKKLSRFGEVQIPPPTLVKGMKLSDEMNIPILPLDFNEEEYTSVYAKEVGGLTMIRQSLRLKRVNRRKFKCDTPEEFIFEWDRISNRLKGHRKLESRRERHMAGRIRRISKKYDILVCIVELERMEGIYDLLK